MQFLFLLRGRINFETTEANCFTITPNEKEHNPENDVWIILKATVTFSLFLVLYAIINNIAVKKMTGIRIEGDDSKKLYLCRDLQPEGLSRAAICYHLYLVLKRSPKCISKL